jgi:hypothetical protein
VALLILNNAAGRKQIPHPVTPALLVDGSRGPMKEGRTGWAEMELERKAPIIFFEILKLNLKFKNLPDSF